MQLEGKKILATGADGRRSTGFTPAENLILYKTRNFDL